MGAAGELGDQGGLALAGLAGDQHNLTTGPRGHTFERALEQLELLLPADDAHSGTVRQAGREAAPVPPGRASTSRGSQADLEGLDGVGQALQLELAQRREGVVDRRPALARTRSATRIWPASARAHNRAASMTGSPK